MTTACASDALHKEKGLSRADDAALVAIDGGFVELRGMKTFLALVALIGLVVYLSFGTLSPCGMLRENVRKHDGLAAILPDGLVDAGLAAQYGELSPGRCISILLNGQSTPVAATPVPPPPQVQQQPPVYNGNAFANANAEAGAAISQCRAKRLRGELRSYLGSAQCSNPRIIQAFRAANYRYPDLIDLFVKERTEIAEELDAKRMTEAQAQVENARMFSELVEAERQRDAKGK